MALTNAQIINQACAIAKCPGMIILAGQLYNSILRDLAEQYDFDIMKVTDFTITTGTVTENSSAGPYDLPSNYLRNAPDEVNYTYNNQPYVLTQIPMWQWRSYYLSTGIQNLPLQFATDFSTVEAEGNPSAYFWPPPNGAYVVLWPYFKEHTDITTPESSTASPWFPNTTYLITRLAGELMKITDDTRWREMLGNAADDLNKYMTMKDDVQGYSQRVKLDRNYFPGIARNLKNTKLIGW